jgi:RNA polymerase sigma factor (sigma-70 family)
MDSAWRATPRVLGRGSNVRDWLRCTDALAIGPACVGVLSGQVAPREVTMTVDALRRFGGRPGCLLDKYGRARARVPILRERAARRRGGHPRDRWIRRVRDAGRSAVVAPDRGQPRAPAPTPRHPRRAADLRPESTGIRDRTDAADRAALWQAIAALPPLTRAAIVLRYYADLPVIAVAAALGVSANTVKSQLKSGLEHLRSALADAPIALPEVPNA